MTGEAADLDKPLQTLNRTVRWRSRRLQTEADPRHVKEVIKALGLEGASPALAPGVAVKGESRRQRRQHRPRVGAGGDHHVPCGRGEAELLVPRPARHYFHHHEILLKDVSAGRTRPEEHEENGSVPH